MINLENMSKDEILMYKNELQMARTNIDLNVQRHISALDAKQGAYKVMMNS